MAESADRLMFLSGNEAIARGAWEAGLRVAASYPGTPATEILETLAGFPEVDTQWSVNEKVAFEVAYGAAVGGVRALYASKHVGLNVAMDPLMTAAYTGVAAGFVVVVTDDPGMHSSQNEQDTRWAALYGKIPLFEPADPTEAYAFVREAFELSERFDTPVLLRTTTRVSHSKENVTVGVRTERPQSGTLPPEWRKYVMLPETARVRHTAVEQRLARLRQFAEQTTINRIEMNDPALGLITSGVSYHYLKETFPRASYLKLGLTYPLCSDKIRQFVGSVREAIVVEELDPFLETLVRASGIEVRGKHPSFAVGELRPEFMADIVSGRPKTDAGPAGGHPPRMCPGCPHRVVFTVLRDLGLIVSGDIGCYTLSALPPFSSIHTVLCMGASVTIHEGLRRAWRDRRDIVGVIGDSTFIHSGIPGLINAAYNGCKGLLVILDNGTTAMTGCQPHPGSGITIRNEPTKQLRLEEICRACGADRVDVVEGHDYATLQGLIKARIEEDALSVIIVRSPCLLLR